MNDLTGKRFGLLTVTSPTEQRTSKGEVVFQCKCDCGNWVKVRSSYLTSGKKNDCGCNNNKQHPRYKQGDMLGKFTVKSSEFNEARKKYIYTALCDCGTEVHGESDAIKKKRYCTNPKCRFSRAARPHTLTAKNDITGKKFGRLTVIRPTEYRASGAIVWETKCDCGKTYLATHKNMRYGNVVSCGCYFKELVASKEFRDKIKGKRKNLLTAFNTLMRLYKRSAKEREYEFNLSEEDFYELTKGSCYYCGKEPTNIQKKNNEVYIYNGIDRVDSKLGYTKENCVSCCTQCNVAKLDYSKEEFLSWIEKVYKHNYGV
jgi:hypothetical protein